MQAHGVRASIFKELIPSVRVAAGHLRHAHEMPGIAAQDDRLAIQQKLTALRGELPPAEASVSCINGFSSHGQIQQQAVKIWRPGTPLFQTVIYLGSNGNGFRFV